MSELKSTNLSAALNAAKLNASLNSTIRLNDYIITLEEIEGGHRLTARKGDSVQSMDIMDGTPGISPIITVTDIDGGHCVTITDVEGEKSFDVMDGKDGEGGGASVQPDLNQNDPEAADYVRNRTHWLERPYEPIVWDGSTEGRDSVDISLAAGYPAGSIFVYKISDKIFTEEEIKKANIFAMKDGEKAKYRKEPSYNELVAGAVYTSSIDIRKIFDDDNGYIEDFASFQLMYTYISGDFSDSLGVVIPSTGTYAMQEYNAPFVLEVNNDVYYPFDERYMPDTIATKEYVDGALSKAIGDAIGGSY